MYAISSILLTLPTMRFVARALLVAARGLIGTPIWLLLSIGTMVRCSTTRVVPHRRGRRRGHPDRPCVCKHVTI